jgi:eukaryotic-like serine/threonine-protein kinase
MIGRTLGHYRIIEKLGEGGMGVVYKAQDLHLGRLVALKVLPPDKLSDPERQQRFTQEAKAASALNHPHIITIYDIASDGGLDFIAMEYVAGKTLDQVIPRKGLRLTEALKCAVQMADALAKAHAAGIIHRDLKPSNVMVTDDGQVKVLDFGLAKLTEAAPLGDDEPTRTVKPTTDEGTIVGTVAYMSPEQAQGKKVDARSDIFSFGAVLYEVVTGCRAFQGETRASTLAAVLKDEPKPASQIALGLPKEVERLIRRCLHKDPAHRFQHMDDLKVALEELKEESDSGTLATAAAGPARRRGRWRWLLAAGVTAAVMGAAGWFWVTRSGAPRPDMPAAPVPLTGFSGSERFPSFSPDGGEVAFAWNGETEDDFDIYIKQIGPPGSRQQLTDNPANETSPAWSPDGRWIAFLRRQQNGAVIVLIPSRGGPESSLTETTIARSFLSWTPDGKWLAFSDLASGEPVCIWAIEIASGQRRRLTRLQTIAQGTDSTLGDYCPSFSPDGRWLAFARAIRGYVVDLFVLPLTPEVLPAGHPTQITNERHPDVSGLAWTPDSREIVYSAGTYSTFLWRVNVSGGQRPKRLTFAFPSSLYPAIAGATQRLVYTWTLHDEHLWRLNIGTGERQALIRSTNGNQLPQYSPDGGKIAFQSAQSGSVEVWTCEANGANPRQLTHILGPQCGAPRWSPDGRWLAFDSREEGHSEIYVIAADGRQKRRVTDSSPFSSSVPGWSRDGRWIFFACDRTGRQEIWKVPAGGGRAEQVTHAGGFGPLASTDGKHVYYTRAGSLWRVPIDGGGEQQMPAKVFYWANFAVTAKGIYFMPDAKTIQFLDPTTSRISPVATIDKPLGGAGAGICVSPDDGFLLWSQVAVDSSDLMLVEKFR